MKKLVEKYFPYLLLLYFPVYLIAFYYIEHFGSHRIHIIECALDHRIPFLEIFIVPYFLWFLYVGCAGLYFLWKEKETFIKFMYLGMIGMTIFIVVSFLYPNGLQLRPTVFPRENIFVDMTRFLYSIDTATNVFPSIHVYNSLMVHACILHSERLKNKTILKNGSFVLCALIILSTMFLKQHSVFDVISATGVFLMAYEIVYCNLFDRISVSVTEAKMQRRVKYKGNFH